MLAAYSKPIRKFHFYFPSCQDLLETQSIAKLDEVVLLTKKDIEKWEKKLKVGVVGLKNSQTKTFKFFVFKIPEYFFKLDVFENSRFFSIISFD